MIRHRGQFDPTNPQPYELSRSKVETFIRCPACFWLDRVAGVKFPTFPPFNLNSNTDKLLKRDFDAFRGQGPHPLMTLHGLSTYGLLRMRISKSGVHRFILVRRRSTSIRCMLRPTSYSAVESTIFGKTQKRANCTLSTIRALPISRMTPSPFRWRVSGRKAISDRWICTNGSCAARVLRCRPWAILYT